MQTTQASYNVPGPQAIQLMEDALAASKEGDGARAVHLFLQAVALAPSWHVLHFLLASEYAAAGDFGQAETHFAQTVLLAPDFHIARYQLGLLQFSGGRPQAAMLTWSPLQSLPLEEPFPHLIKAFSALMADRLEEASTHFEAGLPLAIANAGLEADIRKLLISIEERLSAARTTGTNAAGSSSDRADKLQASPTHVLLSNYRGGTVH